MPLASASILPRERPRLAAPSVAPLANGVDLAATTIGLHASYRIGSGVWVETSTDQGATWPTRVLVAQDAVGDSVPTLAVDRWDNLFVCFHRDPASGLLEIWYSSDFGVTWGAFDNPAGLKYPRMACGLARWYLAYHDGASLRLYGAPPGQLVTFSTAGTLLATLSMPSQLVTLRVDRREVLQLVYADAGGNLQQRYWDEAAAAWSAASLVGAGYANPGAGYGIEGGPLVARDGSGALWGYVLDETGASLRSGPASIPVGFAKQSPGVTVDRRDVGWMVGQVTDATLETWVAPDFAAWRQVS